MPASLRRVAAHQVGSAEAGVTLVTQCSLDRMDRLLPLLAAWDGPLVAAVLCFDGERSGRVHQRDGHAQLRALLAQVPTRHAVCRIGLFVEDGLAGGPLGALYPINAMRNAAIGLATSALVLPLDVDFLPCAGLHASLARPDALAAAQRACCEERWMLVLPVRGSLTLTLALTLTLTLIPTLILALAPTLTLSLALTLTRRSRAWATTRAARASWRPAARWRCSTPCARGARAPSPPTSSCPVRARVRVRVG